MHSEDIYNGELTAKKFAGFVWPSVLMMVVMALYYTIDSIFVANYVGEEGLAAINIAYPVQGLMWGVAVMLAAGSSALVAIEMGKGNMREADSKFTFICVFGLALGCGATLLMFIFMDPVVDVLGATELLAKDCALFLKIFVWGCPAAFLGVLFEFFIRVDGKPAFTIFLYIGGGVTHLGLDIILMGPLHMGLAGAAVANVGGLWMTALTGLGYFLFAKTRLSFSRFHPDFRYIGHSFVNGSPELVNESAAGIMVFCYNMIVVRLAGEIGVAAAAIVLNIHYFFMSVHMGYSVGVTPLISYWYGAGMTDRINKVMKYTKKYMLVASVAIAALCFILAEPLTMIYERPGSELFEMSSNGLRIVSLSLLVIGINVFASNMFTAYGNGLVSTVIAIARGLVFLLAGLLILPELMGMDGAWLALPFGDILTLGLSFLLLRKYSRKYNYKILGE